MHVPFCRRRCSYCDFYSCVIEGSAGAERYLKALERSLADLPRGEKAPTLYVGGGTPTVLPPSLFDRLLSLLAPRRAAGGEWTVEANPESLDEEKCRLLRAAGVTRLSLGVQSLREEDLAFLGRAHDGEGARRALELAANLGPPGLAADLLLGLPGQGKREVAELVEELVGRGVEHLSFYLLTLEKGTPLARRAAVGNLGLPGPEEQAELLLFCRRRLEELGLAPYEISNAARPGRVCRHNLRYWQGGDYQGLGPAAAGLAGRRRWRNLADTDAWAEAVLAGRSPVATKEELTPAQAAGERAWLMLRTTRGLDLERVGELTGCGASWLTEAKQRLESFVQTGLVTRAAGRFRLTEKGVLQADGLGAALLAR